VIVIAAVVLAGAIAITLLTPGSTVGFLDPGDPSPTGAQALATILAQHGHQVTRVTTADAAAAAARGADATLLVTSPVLLSGPGLAALARIPADRVIVEPDARTLRALAPAVRLAGTTQVGPVQPRCSLPAAALAGNANMGGLLLATSAPGAQQCYPAAGHPSLVRYVDGGHAITVFGSGDPFSDAYLGRLGNAALTLNVLAPRARIVWLVPSLPPPGAAGSGPGSGGQKSVFALIPWPAYLVALQLGVAVLLCALWRARRLGPLVPERLPAVVRAAETVEGHGRLYRSRRSRDRAAAALRDAARSRLAARLGLPEGAQPAALAAVLAGRTGHDAGHVAAILFGPVPPDDAALVRLADALDTLEKEVRTP
jgi:hypothetical protein